MAEYLERLIESLQQSANDTFTTEAINTPANAKTLMAMVIKKIVFDGDVPSGIDGVTTQVRVGISSRDPATVPNLADEDYIASFEVYRRKETDANGFSDVIHVQLPNVWNFDDDAPIIAKDKIYLWVSSVNTATQVAGRCRIYYKLKKLTAAQFLDLVTDDVSQD